MLIAQTTRTAVSIGLRHVGMRALELPPVPRLVARGVASLCARAFAMAGEARANAWLAAALAWAGGRTGSFPAFRLSTELRAAGVDARQIVGALERVGVRNGQRHARVLSTAVGITAGAAVRRRTALWRHQAAPEVAPPPVHSFVLATTVHCNLRCVGCYTESQRTGSPPPDTVVDSVLEQGKRLGLLRVNLVGKGEPFMSPRSAARTLGLLRRHPDVLFHVFTNAVAISDATWAELAELPHVSVVTSINGLRDSNDRSRGAGVFDAVMRACMRANARGVPHGFSVTVTSENYREVTSPAFLSLMDDAGHAFGLFFKYAALDPASPPGLALAPAAVRDYEDRLRVAAQSSKMLLVDPDVFERGLGCRARAGALVYVDLVTGSVSPCVRTPFSPPEANLLQGFHDHRLAEVLCTPFFQRYRLGFRRGVTCSSHGASETEWFLGDVDIDEESRRRLVREAEARGQRVQLKVLP